MIARIVFSLVLLMASCSIHAITENNHEKPSANIPNKFGKVKIHVIKSDGDIQCHVLSTPDVDWVYIPFDELPQNQHFCIRAWINIDSSLLSPNPSLLVSMLAASTFYWDEMLISQNGAVGTSIKDEIPGTIKTLVRIPDTHLNSGRHLLSGEISTFNVGKQLDSIGYILAIVNEQQLYSFVLILSVLSAAFIGVSLILAMIFQLIYWLYQKETSYQVFSLFCLTSAFILTAEQAKFWLDYTYNWHLIRLSLIYCFTFIASFLLPLFYLFDIHLPFKKLAIITIFISLVGLSFVKLSFDQTSTLLFSGALIWALAINIYNVIDNNQGQGNVFIIFISLMFLYFIPDYFNEFGFSIVFVFIVMTMLVALIKEMHTNKIKALKAERIKTELLRRNIQPHFLMNCLTQLMELIEVKPKSAIEFIVILADEFRQLITQNNKQQIPLSDEIMLCNKHLTIMAFRYQQAYHLNIEGEIDGILIPPSILHSQIENCFTHNEISSDRAFELIVSTQKGRINLILKTPIEKRINHQGTGLGEQYIKAKLAEVDQIRNHRSGVNSSIFESYQERKYWVSKFSFIV